MSEQLFELADRLRALRDEKTEAEQRLKEINAPPLGNDGGIGNAEFHPRGDDVLPDDQNPRLRDRWP